MTNKIYNKIKEIMWKKELTVEEIAHRSGLSISEISRVANGKRIPNQITIAMICKGLDMPAQEIFDFDYDHMIT